MDNIKGLAEVHDGNIHLVSLNGTCQIMDKTHKLGLTGPTCTKTMLVVNKDFINIKVVKDITNYNVLDYFASNTC